MATFSWADTARAVFASCLPCLPSARPVNSNNDDGITRRDELESLLQGAEFTDTETDADVLSLHSNIGQHDGRRRVKKKRTRNKGSITLFGFDLFGRPLQGPENVEDDGRDVQRRVSRISSSTLDSDAAPLADEAIAELSARSPEQRAADEARRARKRLRKQQKAAALLDTHGDTFEGFPGSGSLQPQSAREDFGAFQQAPLSQPQQHFEFISGGGLDEEEDAQADFDAGSYVRSAAPPRSDSGSGTRSRTSTSSSPQQLHPHMIPLPPSSAGSTTTTFSKPRRSKKAKSGARSPTTLSSTTASQPHSPTSAVPAPNVAIANPQDPVFEGVPQDAVEFVGKPRKSATRLTGESVHGEQELPVPPRLADFPSHGFGPTNGFPSPGLGRSGSGFPSPGLGGRKNSLIMGSQGAFLARTGEDA